MKSLAISHSQHFDGEELPRMPHHVSHFEQKDEQEVWDMFRKGDQGALIFIYSRYYADLNGYALQFTTNKETIKDCIQELFITLFKGKEKLGATTSIKFYLYRSLRRLIAKEIRTATIYTYNSPEQVGMDFNLIASAEKLIIQRETAEINLLKLQNAINQLPIKQKEAIYYFFYESFSYQQIADLMGHKKVKTARTLVYRALQSLKESMADDTGNVTRILNAVALLMALQVLAS